MKSLPIDSSSVQTHHSPFVIKTENNSRSGDDDAAPSCTPALGDKLSAAPAAASLPPSSIFSQRDHQSCIPNQPTFVTFRTPFG
ncbi:unnamed protein product [Mesocestoides corti]|uniref:Uncharacterized protein n=1 Tax=Mesocestoides corti TaxID=53468 RepID=A0A0R3UD29_MESCO|nr:unnamed protein product [Mesocestoides corti]